jgi:ParB-like nuclease family protein
VHELESQSADTVHNDMGDATEPETGDPIPSAQVRQREGLPPQYRMRAERHYVDHLSAPSSSVPVQLIPIGQLSPRPQSAPKDLDALVRSVRAHGILQPLLVRRDRTGYHVIAGSKRLGAAVTAGLAEVPCIVHHVDEAGATALEAAEKVRGERAGGGALRASVGGRITEGVTAIADDLSRIRATVGLLRSTPTGFQQVVAIDLLAAQTWRALWLANVASFLSGGKYPEGRIRPLPVVVDDIVERFEPECRLSRLRFTVLHSGAAAPHVGDGPVGFALTSAIIVTLALLDPGAEPALDIHTQTLGESGFVIEVAQRHSFVPRETAERISNQALSAPAAGNTGLGALALSHVTALYGGASELAVTDEPGSTLRLTFAHF